MSFSSSAAGAAHVMRRSSSSPTSNSIASCASELVAELGERGRVVGADLGIGGEAQLVGAQVDEELHAVVEAGEQLEQARRGRRERGPERPLGAAPARVAGGGLPGRDRAVDASRVGPEVAGEHREEADPAPVGERAVRVGDRGDVGALGRGVVALEQMGDDVADARRVAVVEIGPDVERDPGAAPAGAAAEAIEEATGRHHATIVHPPCAMH